VNDTSSIRRSVIMLAFAVLGWAMCGAIIGIGRHVTTMQATLIIHAIGAPLLFAALAWVHHTWIGGFSPLRLAGYFLGIVMGLDFFIVAPFMERSYAMFSSVLGTWIPFLSLFIAAWLSGWRAVAKRTK